MAEDGKRIRLRSVGLVIGFLLFIFGVVLTESDINELGYGSEGTFTYGPTDSGTSVVVFVENTEYNCEAFQFDLVNDEDVVQPVEKTDCTLWSSSDMYQFKIGTMAEDDYKFSASDEVSIVAVEGDLGEYMEDYALGNALSDIGAGVCCLSFIVPMFFARFRFAAVKEGDQMGFVHMPPPSAEPIPGTAPLQDITIADAPVVEEHDQKASVEVEHEPVAPLDEEDRPEAAGSFWDGLSED